MLVNVCRRMLSTFFHFTCVTTVIGVLLSSGETQVTTVEHSSRHFNCFNLYFHSMDSLNDFICFHHFLWRLLSTNRSWHWSFALNLNINQRFNSFQVSGFQTTIPQKRIKLISLTQLPRIYYFNLLHCTHFNFLQHLHFNRHVSYFFNIGITWWLTSFHL